MLKALALVATLASFPTYFAVRGGGDACQASAETPKVAERTFDYRAELFFAVLEGLYVDGVSNEIVDAILAVDETRKEPANFVWGCPICMPAYEALRVYRARPAFRSFKEASDTFGPGLDDATRARVLSADPAVRLKAIEGLVQSWTKRRMDSLRLSEAELHAWRVEMEIGRKKGMAMLFDYQASGTPGQYKSMKACAFCDGANGACGMR